MPDHKNKDFSKLSMKLNVLHRSNDVLAVVDLVKVEVPFKFVIEPPEKR